MKCRITSVETFPSDYPIRGYFRFFDPVSGPRDRETIVVKIATDSGHAGWGQSVPSHRWSYETVETVQSTIDRYLGPRLVGQDPFDTDSIDLLMSQTIAPSFSTGQPICKAGIDLALFDLRGQIRNEDANSAWGADGIDHIRLSWTVDVQQASEVEREIETAQSRGYSNFNLKVGSNLSVDIAVCREVRRLAPQAFIWADANGGYDWETAVMAARQFAECGVAALEQPFRANRLSWYARLRREVSLPILMDEGIVSLVDLTEFHQLGLLDGVAMKVARSGGLSESVRMARYLEQHGLLMYASGLTDPDLSLAASLLLFGAFRLQPPAALNAPQYLTGTILKNSISIEGDRARVPRGPGLGVEVNESCFHDGKLVPA